MNDQITKAVGDVPGGQLQMPFTFCQVDAVSVASLPGALGLNGCKVLCGDGL